MDEILSHPQALAQCRNYLAAHFPNATQRATTSTAEAAREVASRKGAKPFCAAIGTLRAAQLYGLSIIARDIQDVPENETRFILLARGKRAPRTGHDKTSIAFSTVRDRPGALYSILEEFAVRSINLTKIESRPTKRMLGEYIFFVDCEGHEDDPAVREAIKALEPKTSYIKILGSYPVNV
ncbi:MAG TPA: prephenate dehydratase [Firmicutes bacterium]|nr:prephenate dehydratase [Bacillota bacterium]